MKPWVPLAWMSVLAVLFAACEPAARYRVLSVLFDGVPPPPTPVSEVAAPAGAQPVRKIVYGEHGPYAAKLCGACHESAATNKLVAPREQLCFRCHDIKMDKKYIHGPLASGGCTVCHDPHSSRYRYLLISESDSFCLHCHDRDTVMKTAAHSGVGEQCTVCHDAHMSDKRYLLR